MRLSDQDSEKALISNIINYGLESYYDINVTGVNQETFTDFKHQTIYLCCKDLFDRQNIKKIDIPLIISTAKTLGYENWVQEYEIDQYLSDITSIETQIESGAALAKRLRKLEVGNKINDSAKEIQGEVKNISGEESLGDIFGIVEKRFADLADLLTDSSAEPVNIGKSVFDHVKDLEENPVDQIGIPTGFPIFDKCIGGGLRKHAITVIGARAKVGKSTFCKNVGWNVAKAGIPVLILDTEMQTEDQINRLLSTVSDINISDIESGKFRQQKQKMEKAIADIQQTNIMHKNISGMSLESQFAIVRKWLIRNVGLDADGRAKDCLLIYDYIKMMDADDIGKLQEHQAIGFLMTALQNLAVKYDIPILTAAQLNRDGISREDTAAIGASDRISMYASSISLLKWKTEEEMALEHYNCGNQKLVPLISRYGPPMDPGDYINISFDHSKNKMIEDGTRSHSQEKNPVKEAKKEPAKNKKDHFDGLEF